MYQSIDDDVDKKEDEAESSLQSNAKFLEFGLWIICGLAIFVVLALVYTNQPNRIQKQPSEQSLNTEAYLNYRRALGETNVAFRRARLQDFIKVYPTHSRSKAAQLQLNIIDVQDDQDWNKLTELVYNPRLERAAKLSAIDLYNGKWRGGLLGGRNEEIMRLKNEVLGMQDENSLPDRRLDINVSAIPQNIKDDSFLGAPQRETISIERPAQQPTEPVAKIKDDPKVVMPRVRRNATPKYPRKAYKRSIDAIVTLKLNIDAKGKVKMTELVSVEAERYEKNFIRAAERAAMRTRYHPKTIDGKAVPMSGFIRRYRFSSTR